jgi:competence protein ComEA
VHSFNLSRRAALAFAACAIVVVVAAAHFFGGAPQSSSPGSQVGDGSSASIPALTTPSGAEDDDTAETGDTAPSSSTILTVDVAGAVRRPGLYRLPHGSRIADAVARAGGMDRTAQVSLVNLAAPLADGEQVLVPGGVAAGGAEAAPAASSAGPSPTAPVDLNSATAEQLDALPGVGPVTAQKIVDYRTQHGPFTSVDDLDAIPGIGPARIDTLRGLVIA